ncbi:hypothetical protein [Streptomyces sp. MP131-18]|nr:hypothetical protein [Streptomyces sp. MP131-18]ONK13856.1 hypothetical protein STBA_46310 [Streptomyces sp. MP131-18]
MSGTRAEEPERAEPAEVAEPLAELWEEADELMKRIDAHLSREEDR